MNLDRDELSGITRRDVLRRVTGGFGALAWTALASDRAFGAQLRSVLSAADDKRIRQPDYAPKAKNVIFLYMDGAPSQVDTFDPKPRLDRDDGKPIPMKVPPTQFDNVGGILKSPWKFRRYGESGLPVSDLFPHVGRCADKLAVVRSMTSKFSEHTNANYFLHTGHGIQGRPSWGSWVTYGLGSECNDLPGFVVLNGGLIPRGGLDCFLSGFLPADFQGSIMRAGKSPIANIVRRERNAEQQIRKLALLQELDRSTLEREPSAAIESAIKNQELAFRMQASVPELADLRGESKATLDLYGCNAEFHGTRTYGSICLLARRLVERGVRFVELTCPSVGHDRWDQHGKLRKGHADNARAVDQPIAGLLTDLEARGLLSETIVIWSGEFGRTPMAQGRDGRDHNPFGFSMWMAGAGIKAARPTARPMSSATSRSRTSATSTTSTPTVLHLLGLDHERLTYRFSGRDFRLTDVHGRVLHDILV